MVRDGRTGRQRRYCQPETRDSRRRYPCGTHGLHFWKNATGEPVQAEAKSGPAIDDQAEARADAARLRSEIAGGFSR